MVKDNSVIEKILKKGIKNEKLVLIILGVILFLIIAMPTDKENKTPKNTESNYPTTELSYQELLENRIKNALDNVANVGDTQVVITLKNTSTKVVKTQATNSQSSLVESEGDNARRESTDSENQVEVVYQDDENGKVPYVVEEEMPDVMGVVVIAKGGDNPQVVADVTQAVEALLSVPTHKIKVLKMK